LVFLWLLTIYQADKLGTKMKPKNAHAVALGRMGGSKGGKTRAAKLTAEERSASARKAALARWAKADKNKR
jgi:hypothetical protein